jgi:hypothetical protein
MCQCWTNCGWAELGPPEILGHLVGHYDNRQWSPGGPTVPSCKHLLIPILIPMLIFFFLETILLPKARGALSLNMKSITLRRTS